MEPERKRFPLTVGGAPPHTSASKEAALGREGERDFDVTKAHLPEDDSLLDPALSELVQLGLSRGQARAYLSALVLGKACAKAIAQHSRLDVPATYRAIDDLVKMELLMEELGVPNVYAAVDAACCVRRLISRYESELTSRVRLAEKVVPMLDEIERQRDGSRRQDGNGVSYRLFMSQTQRESKLKEALAAAMKEVLVFAPKDLVSMLANRAFEALMDVWKEDVEWRCIVEADSSVSDLVKLSPYLELRRRSAVPFDMEVIDREVVAIRAGRVLARHDGDAEPGLLITDSALAGAMAALFESMWRECDRVRFARGRDHAPSLLA